MRSRPLERPLAVEVITYVPSQYNHCPHCEVTWHVAGIRQRVQREMAETGLPDDLKREFHDLSEWAHTLPAKFGDRVRLRLVDAASIEGFVKSLLRGFHRYPAFTVAGRRYVGSEFARVEALIAEGLVRARKGG
jgi:hypothetical protein